VNFDVTLTFERLRCVQTDENPERPYLWTFFFQLDGSTVAQLNPTSLQLLGKVKVAAGYGGHGNLEPAECGPGATPHIPSNVGVHQTKLRPIRLQVLGQKIMVPGRLLSFCVLMEEDATADSTILKAHEALRDFLEQQWNDFIGNTLNQGNITAEASALQASTPELSGRPLLMAAVQSLIDKFVDGLEAPATQVVKDAVIDDSSIFQLIANWVDADDSMGTQKFSFDERGLIQSGLLIPVDVAIVRTEDGAMTAVHELHGGVRGHLAVGGDDLVTEIPDPGVPTTLDSGEYRFEQGYLCIPANTVVEWRLLGSAQAEEIHFTYPFLDVEWSIENHVLKDASGTLQINKSCGFPAFDPSQPPRLQVSHVADTLVTVRYEIADKGDEGKVLKVWNDPRDGNYSFIVAATGVASDVVVPLGSVLVTFGGQRIELGPPDFVSQFEKCMKSIASVSEDYAKSKKPSLKDIWDPRSRFKAYEDMLATVDHVAAVRGLGDG